MMLDLSVVLPVYDEEESLTVLWPDLLAVLESLSLRFEVIFVDDGSTDRSADIIRGFHEADARVRLLRLKAHAGQTAASDAGLKAARGRQVVMMAADLQDDPHEIPRLLQHLDAWDAVTGRRSQRHRGHGLMRRISSVLAWVRHRLNRGSLPDRGPTCHAFRRECLNDLVLYHDLHCFIPALLGMRGRRMVEVPVKHRPRRFRRSEERGPNRILVRFCDLLVVRWMNDRYLRYEVAEDLGGR